MAADDDEFLRFQAELAAVEAEATAVADDDGDKTAAAAPGDASGKEEHGVKEKEEAAGDDVTNNGAANASGARATPATQRSRIHHHFWPSAGVATEARRSAHLGSTVRCKPVGAQSAQGRHRYPATEQHHGVVTGGVAIHVESSGPHQHQDGNLGARRQAQGGRGTNIISARAGTRYGRRWNFDS